MLQFIFVSLLAALLSYLGYVKRQNSLSYIAWGLVVYILAFQDCIGIDFDNYYYEFNRICNSSEIPTGLWEGRFDSTVGIETGWWALNKFIGKTVNSFYCVTFIVYSILIFAIISVVKRLPKEYECFGILYFFYSPMLFYMSGMRQGFAVALFILSVLNFIDKKYIISAVLFIVGTTIHTSMMYSVAFLPLCFIDKLPNSKKIQRYIGLVLACLFAIALVYGRTIQQSFVIQASAMMGDSGEYIHYFDELEATDFSVLNLIGKFFIFFFSLYAFFKAEGFSRFVLACFIIGQIGEAFFGQNGTLGRIMLYVSVFATPAIIIIPHYVSNKDSRIIFILVILFLIFRQFTNSISTVDQFKNYLDYHTILF